MPSALVSIVMPAYRADRYVGGALEGIRRQTHRNWELICVEDGSADATQETIEAFAVQEAGHRVVYLRHEANRGLSASRNTALSRASGEFVAFLDADDVWLQSHLECSVRRLEETQTDVAYSTVVKFEDRSGLLLGLWGPTKRDLETFPGSLLARNFVVPSATVLRRHVVDQVGPFDTSLRWCEDFDYWLRCVMAGMQFVHVPGCHCLYRKGAPTAGSSKLRAVNEHHALVLAKHFGAPSFPKRQWRRQLAFYCLTAGVLNLETDARSARRLFWKAWRTRPERLDLLLLATLAASVLRWLPVGPVVRRLRKAKGY